MVDNSERKTYMRKENQRLYKAIGHIAWGYIFIHFDINLGAIDILPTWLGIFFIVNAIKHTIIMEESSAKLIMPLGTFLCLDSFVTWLCNILSVSFDIYIYGLVVTIISLYFHFQLLTNLANIANLYDCKEETKILTLRTVKTMLATAQVFLLQLEHEIIMVGLAMVQIVVCIWLCKVLFDFRKNFQSNHKNE